ncbi:DUF6928 family protein [Streptomyces fagopyri]|uniref:DUF6928 family protein n=1 Tax=Streptomyces fagopyri TaxID=2662397 RepID=UPI003715CB51
MGARTALLIYADGEVPDLLRHVEAADLPRTSEMMRRLYPGWEIEQVPGSTLGNGVYPPKDTAYAASRPGVEIVCDQRVMIDFPSQLPQHLVAASAGRRLVLHAMHSVVDWLAFAVWEDGRLVRSLSLSPDSGIIENIGEPLPFELPCWAGDRPADIVPWPDEDEEPGLIGGPKERPTQRAFISCRAAGARVQQSGCPRIRHEFRKYVGDVERGWRNSKSHDRLQTAHRNEARVSRHRSRPLDANYGQGGR